MKAVSMKTCFTCFACWVEISADDNYELFMKYFSYFSLKISFDISCKLSPKETICIKWQTLFLEKNKNKCNKLSYADFVHIVVKVNICII